MRLPAIVIAAVLCASTAAAANDGPWCYRVSGAAPQNANCSFYSLRQCLIVAGTMGGICARNEPPAQAAAVQPEKSKKTRH